MTSQLQRFRQRAQERWLGLGDAKIEDEFVLQEQIGSGSYATVHRCIKKDGNIEMAVKIIEKDNLEVMADALQNEVRILRNITHDNVLSLKHVFEDDTRVYVVMDLMRGGELYEKICRDFPDGYSEAVCSRIIANVIRAIGYLHEKGIIHRDLKPENLLFAEKGDDATDIRIADFGLAKIWSGDMLVRTACGSPNYVAPEILLNPLGGYSFAVDMWSVGVILYVMLCGFCPFHEKSQPALLTSITSGNYSFPSPYWDAVSEDARSMVRGLLCVDTEARFTPAIALRHPFITKHAGGDQVATIPGITRNMRRFMQAQQEEDYRSSSEEEEEQ